MKYFGTLLSVCILLLSLNAHAQKAGKQKVEENYARSSLTYLLLDFGTEKYEADIQKAFLKTEVCNKFDDNNAFFTDRIIEAPYARIKDDGSMSAKDALDMFSKPKLNDPDSLDVVLLGSILQSNLPEAVIFNWWDLNPDGSFPEDMTQSTIAKRGAYNANDEDYNIAMAKKVGVAELSSAGAQLIDNSYFLIFDYHDIMTMDEYYNAKTAAGVKIQRTKNGYMGSVTAVLMKVRFDEEMNAIFEDAIGEDGKVDHMKFRENFKKNMDHVSFIVKVSAEVDGSQDNELPEGVKKKSKEELFDQMVASAVDQTLFKITRLYEPFRVKAPLVHKQKAIGAKIGKKEGVNMEQRFFVWQYKAKIDENGTVSGGKYKRKGVVRGKKIVNNLECTPGKTDTSTFYQVAGGKLRDGMILQQHEDLGIGITAGYRAGEIGGINGRLEYNASQLLNGIFSFPVTSLKLCFDLGIQSKKYDVALMSSDNTDVDWNFTTLAIGLSKDFYFFRNYAFIPYVGYGLDMAKEKEASSYDVNIKSGMLNAGARISANILYNIQIVGGVDYFMPMGDPKITVDGEEYASTATWTDLFKDREGLSFSFGLRYQF